MTPMNLRSIMYALKYLEDQILHPILFPAVDRVIKLKEVKIGSRG